MTLATAPANRMPPSSEPTSSMSKRRGTSVWSMKYLPSKGPAASSSAATISQPQPFQTWCCSDRAACSNRAMAWRVLRGWGVVSVCIHTCFQLLVAPLGGVPTAKRNEARMVALLMDAPVLEHQNVLGIHHGAQAVADNDGSLAPATFAQRLQVLQDASLGLGVNGRQCIVQQQQRCVRQQRTCNCHALALPARKRNALLANRCVIALRHACDVFVD